MSLRYATLKDVPAHLLPGSQPQPKRAKYGNIKAEEDGHRFDSKFELQRYRELKAMEQCNLISCLRVHTSFGLHVNGKRIGSIIPDFDYRRNGITVVEDVKSPVSKTQLYEWKRTHLLLEYGIEIVEVMRNKPRAA